MNLSKASKSSIACSGLSKITKPIDYKDPIFAKLFARILARDGNGAGPKDGVFTPAPHDFDLPYPHLASPCMTGKISCPVLVLWGVAKPHPAL